MFKELVKISMKKAYDTNINMQNHNLNNFYSKQLDSDFLQAKRSDLQYSMTSYLVVPCYLFIKYTFFKLSMADESLLNT